MLTPSTSSVAARSGTIASLPFLSEISAMFYDLRWFILLCIALVFVDFKFGIENSRVHKRNVRTSTAVRRTVNKLVDYLCWIIVAGFMGKAICGPLDVSQETVSFVVLCVATAAELDSIIENYYEARGVKGVSLWKFLVSLIRLRSNGVADAVEETIDLSHKHEQDTTES